MESAEMMDENLPEQIPQMTPLPSSTMAIISLVTGILSYFGLPVIGAIIAIITGYMARSETRSVPPTASGDGMATAGIVLGWVHIGLLLAGLLCFVLWMVFMVGLFAVGGHGFWR
jgi:hypothetical protein